MTRLGLCSIFCAILWAGAADGGCPDPHQIEPCNCLKSRSIVTCEDVTDAEVLKSVMKASKSHKIVGVELFDVALRYIPYDAFEGTNIKSLEITNSSIMSLSDTDQAFKGLEKSLTSFKVTNCSFVAMWDWTQLSSMTKIEVLEISESELLEVAEEFLKLAHFPAVDVVFRDCGLFSVPDGAFSTYKDLNKITMDQNSLSDVKRCMFPRPAEKLTAVGLSHNRIRELPEDLFTEMPKLKFLYLGGNPMHVLSENLLKPVWKTISMFIFHDTHLVCDCRLSWITKVKSDRKLVYAPCSEPRRLKGRKITTLEPEELWC